VKLPGAEREGYIFKGWYTDRQVFIVAEGETYKPNRRPINGNKLVIRTNREGIY